LGEQKNVRISPNEGIRGIVGTGGATAGLGTNGGEEVREPEQDGRGTMEEKGTHLISRKSEKGNSGPL